MKNYDEQTAKLSHGSYTMVQIKLHTSKNNFDVCTMHLVQFIVQTNKCTTYIYINNILYIVSTSTCFDASVSSSGGLIHLFC